jgi:guanosine-3',5'-bis(diphosphate) 3'-pyrophosphohydrolase
MMMLIKAIELAAEAHRYQKRKDVGKTAYINHPIEVMGILRSAYIVDEEILAAAVLHDVIEDTTYDYYDIRWKINENVADYVFEVSDDKNLPKQKRKDLQIETMSTKSDGAKLIKIADKISNMKSIIATPPVDWDSDRKKAYFDWAKQVVDQGRGMNIILDDMFDSLYSLRNGL